MCGSSSERSSSETSPTSGKSAASTAARTRSKDWALLVFNGRLLKDARKRHFLPSGVRRHAHVLEAAVDGERDDHRRRTEPLRKSMGADDIRAGGDPGEDSLLLGESQRHGEGFVVLDRLDVVNLRG